MGTFLSLSAWTVTAVLVTGFLFAAVLRIDTGDPCLQRNDPKFAAFIKQGQESWKEWLAK